MNKSRRIAIGGWLSNALSIMTRGWFGGVPPTIPTVYGSIIGVLSDGEIVSLYGYGSVVGADDEGEIIGVKSGGSIYGLS